MSATMKDIARETGLGLATISKYFNGGQVRPHNRKLIEDAVRKLDYVPNEFARSLKTRQSRTVGVVIPELGNAFITSIITTMEDILRKHDYAVIVCDCRSDPQREKEAVDFLIHKRVDGLINMATDMSGAHLHSALKADVPVVLVDRLIKSLRSKVSAVVVDNTEAADQGTRYLLDQGHREIGLVLGSQSLYTTEHRLKGYLDALTDFGVTPREELIRYGNYTLSGGYEAVREFMSMDNRPTALFVTNFEMTLGAMLALSEMNIRVPEDLSVIGFDKLDVFDGILSNLTLIKQPQNVIGQQAARLILSMMNEEDVPAQIVTLSTQPHDGSSVRRLNAEEPVPEAPVEE